MTKRTERDHDIDGETAETRPKPRKRPSGSAREQALRLLAGREYSSSQLRQKLARSGHSLPEIDAVLHEFKERQWQSDERFADMRTRGLKARGAGPLRIRLALRQAGIGPRTEAMDEAAGNLLASTSDAEWIALAQAALQSRFGDSPASDRAEWLKRARWLLARGFTETQIRSALKEQS